MKLYVGCSLTQAPEAFKTNVENLKKELQKEFEIFDFIGLTKGTAEDVYRWDVHECVAKCDMFVAICDFPSIGLGYELGVAVEKLNKPTLALAHSGSKLSRLLLGINLPHYKLVRYETTEQIPMLVRAFVNDRGIH